MKPGLRGPVRKVGVPCGVAVALNPLTGRLWRAWQRNMKGEEKARIRGAWAGEPDIDGHKGEEMQAVDAPQGAAALHPLVEPGRALLPGAAPGPRGPGLSDPAGQGGRAGSGLPRRRG